jgi:oligosaccharide repeat unit polymerase
MEQPGITKVKEDTYLLNLPIRLVCFFLLITVFLYLWGPIDYNPHTPFLTSFYLLCCILCLYLGFKVSTKRPARCQLPDDAPLPDNSSKALRVFDRLFIIYIILIPLTLYSRTGSFFFNFSSFQNLGAAYSLRAENNSIPIIEWLRVFASPLTLAFIPFGILNFRHLNKLRKLLFIAGIVGYLLIDLTCGVNKSFADVMIFCFIFYLASINNRRIGAGIRNKDRSLKANVRKLFAVMILVALTFFVFFSATVLSRTMNPADDYSTSFKYLVSYLTQGYRAVDYSLSQSFTSTYGFGSSMYLLDSTRDWFNTADIMQRSYLYKNQVLYGINYKLAWSSLYVWLGNDVSMLGVIPVMFIIGRIFGKTWKTMLSRRNSFATTVVAGLMFQLCMYSPANNQIVQTVESLFGTLFWVAVWFIGLLIKNLNTSRGIRGK